MNRLFGLQHRGVGSGDHFFLTFLYDEGKNTHFSINNQILEQRVQRYASISFVETSQN